MKKLINKRTIASLLSLIICFGLFAQIALAQTSFGLNYASASDLGTRNLKETVFSIINIILGFLGIVAIVIILYAGLTWMTAAGNEEKVTKARSTLIAGIIGLAIVLASWALAQFILSSLMKATT